MTYNKDQITVDFPHSTVDPIIWLTTYQNIQELYVKANSNAVSIYTGIGDIIHSILHLTVSDTQYNSVSIVPFAVQLTRAL